MDCPNDFNFSLEPKYTKFSMPSTSGEQSYVLREASEEAYTSYRNLTMRSLKFVGVEGGEKRAHMTGGAEADTQLIAKCLFKLVKNGEQIIEEPVPFEFVSSLPRRITSRLYTWIKANSGMDEELETAEFLQARIKSDQEKLLAIQQRGTPGKGEESSISRTST